MKRFLTVPWIAAIATVLIHLIANPHYGFFRDELYFIICGSHPQFGYVDQPPVVPLLAAGTQIFGHSLVLLRAVPALFAGAGVYTTCLIVAEFGGGSYAMALAAVVFLFTGVLSSFGMKVSTDEVGLFTWPLMALFVVRIVRSADPRLWIAVGIAAGISLESKYSVLFFLIALFIALLIVPDRRTMFTPWFGAGAAIASLIALPNLLWQMHYGLPMLQLLEAGQQGKNLIVGPLFYLVQEILITGLFLAVVWIVGLVWLVRSRQFRVLAIAYVLLIVEMIVFHGKHYYPANIYPVLIAAGGVAIESWTQRTAVRAAVVAIALVVGVAFAPLSLPVLPVNTFVAYSHGLSSLLHISRKAMATEHHREDSALPGDWADMHGWPELAATVARIYDRLPPQERARAVAIAGNYGEASAVAFFTPRVPVISGHNQFWLWGTRGYSGDVLIDIGGDCGAKEHMFRSAQRVAVFSDPWAIGYENNLPIMLCRGIKEPLSEVWPSLKNYE